MDNTPSITSPTMPVHSGIVSSPKEFSDGLTLDLTDAEITQALQVTLPIRLKWMRIFRSKMRDAQFTLDEALKLLEDFEDEIVYELATQAHILVHVDAEPVFYGEPVVIEFVGALDSHISAQYGLDHERKEWEVKRAKTRDEAFLGIDTLDE